jgi:molybdate transport system ATP-binding protein
MVGMAGFIDPPTSSDRPNDGLDLSSGDANGSRLDVRFSLSFPKGPEINVSLEASLGDGCRIVLFGPSGAGKTTILRCIAGLEIPLSGFIAYKDQVWLDSQRGIFVPPERRRIGFVHQSRTLFPHMSVLANVAYGVRHRSRKVRRDLAMKALEFVGVGELADRRPRQISGGQAQLVSLARALAQDAQLLLLDEPLSSVDLAIRPQVRRRLKEIVIERDLPTVFVTHDMDEALELGEYIGVVIDGRIAQYGRADTVVSRPANAAIAKAVGIENLVAGHVRRITDGLLELEADGVTLMGVYDAPVNVDPVAIGERVYACIRSADIALSESATALESPRNRIPSRVLDLTPTRGLVKVELEGPSGLHLSALVTAESVHELGIVRGTHVVAVFKAVAAKVVRAA